MAPSWQSGHRPATARAGPGAQSLVEDLPVIGRDEVLKDFGVALVW